MSAFRVSVLVVSVLALASGCAPITEKAYEPIGQHTLRTSADTDTDVIWLQEFDNETKQFRVLRCYNGSAGPSCIEMTERSAPADAPAAPAPAAPPPAPAAAAPQPG